MNTSTVYRLDFRSGALATLENPGLPVGQLLTRSDRWGTKNFVVTADQGPAQGFTARQAQRVICLETGHPSEVHAVRGELEREWQLGDKILSGDDLTAALAGAEANKIRIEAESKAKSEAEAQRKAALRAKWDTEFAWLQRPGGKLSSHACGAKNIKKELARAFPGVKFSVKSDSYSGGDSIDIAWELGPTTREVQAITGKYEEGSFNGMEDIYEYDHGNEWPAIYGGAKYVSENRHDGEAVNGIAAALCARWGLTPPADGRSWWNVLAFPNQDHARNLASEARDLIFKQSYPAGATITGVEEMPDKCGGTELRCVFTLADGTRATWGTPEAKAAHLRAAWAECSGEARGELQAIATRAGLPVLDVFAQYQTWERAQYDAGNVHERAISHFAATIPDAVGQTCPAAPSKAVSANAETLPTASTPDPRPSGDAVTIKLNAEKNGVEIYFASKPPAAVLSDLKSRGWRWSRFNACWYTRQSPEAIAFAQTMVGQTCPSAPSSAVSAPAETLPRKQTRGEIIQEMTRNFVQAMTSKATA